MMSKLMIHNELEAFDRPHAKERLEFKIELFGLRRRLHDWLIQRRERPQYGWVYECGCRAWWGGNSLPYCAEHGMRLMRYKRRG